MKTIYLSIFSLIFSCSALADTYSIDLETEFSNDKPQQARVIVKAGESVELSNDKLTLKLLPTKVDHNIVKLQTEILQHTSRGLKTVAKPSIISYLDSSAEFFQESKDGKSDVRLTVVARKLE